MTGERILIVDDSVESRTWLIEGVMRPAGYVTAEAAGLDEARAQIDAFRPDAIVLDAQLGSADGLDLLRDSDSAIPIVVTTTRRSIDEVLAALRGGAHDVLVKPFEPEQIAASVERALRSVQAAANATRCANRRNARPRNLTRCTVSASR